MNPYEAIEYLKKQGDFLAQRAKESTTEVSILSYSGRADMCYTLASALAILFGARSNASSTIGNLGDAEDKAKALTRFDALTEDGRILDEKTADAIRD